MTRIKGNVSKEIEAGRVSSHGKLASLAAGFKLSNGSPFSVVIVPKANITARVVSQPDAAGLLVDCKMYQDDVSSDYFIPFLVETSAAILELAIAAIDLATYDVFWAAGTDVDES